MYGTYTDEPSDQSRCAASALVCAAQKEKKKGTTVNRPGFPACFLLVCLLFAFFAGLASSKQLSQLGAASARPGSPRSTVNSVNTALGTLATTGWPV